MKFPNLPAMTTLTGAEIVPGTQSGVDGRTTSQAIANLFKGTRGTAIASASSIDLGAATGSNLHVTGTTTITSLGTASAGVEREVVFDGALTLTYNATSLILPTAANITTAAGDSSRFISEGSGNWRCVKYQRASGQALTAFANTPTALTISSNTVTVNASASDYFTLSMTANVTTLTLSSVPSCKTLMIVITQDATGSRTMSWPAAFKWAGGTSGSLSTSASAKDLLAITTFDSGTTWYATLAKAYA